jgi:mono/diheme cytochrome c family protein
MDEQHKRSYLERYREAKERGVPFYPDIVFKDAVVALLVFVLLIGLAYYVGAPLEEPANPNDTTYTPRPEWYFLWIFQMLKYFPGNLEVIAVTILPAIGVAVLLLLPFFDRNQRRHFLSRPIATGTTLLILALVAGLSVQSVIEAPPPQVEAATQGDEIAALYTQNCASCHGPSVDVSPGTDLHAVIAEGAEHEGMPAWGGTLSSDEIDALVGFILSPSGNSIYQTYCGTCHEGIVNAAGQALELQRALEQGPAYPPHGDVDVPDWNEVLSSSERRALLNFLAAPDGERLFQINCAACHGQSVPFDGNREQLRQIIQEGGEHVEMPPWRERLSESALDTLARYVVDPSAVPEGEELFQANCAGCHGDRVPTAPDVESAREIIAQGGAHESMPVWGNVLTAEQLDALVQYTVELAEGAPVELGRNLFQQNCTPCHGNFGEGGPNPAQPGDIIPPISTAEYLSTRDNTTLRAIISQGQPNFGMAPFGEDFGGPLNGEQIDAIVAFLRQWESNPPVETPPEIQVGPIGLTGREVFADICAQCHGPEGRGDIGPSLRDPALQTKYTEQELFQLVNTGHAATPMIGFGDLLTSAQINEVIDYVRQWQAEAQATAQRAADATAVASGEATPVPEAAAATGAAAVSFSQDVVPILEHRCAMCHGGGTALGGWDASGYDTVVNSGDHQPMVVPGDPARSILAQKVLGTYSVGSIMPPSGKMPDEEIQAIVDWIEAGAPDN